MKNGRLSPAVSFYTFTRDACATIRTEGAGPDGFSGPPARAARPRDAQASIGPAFAGSRSAAVHAADSRAAAGGRGRGRATSSAHRDLRVDAGHAFLAL